MYELNNSKIEMRRWVIRISYFVFRFFNSNKTMWPVFNWERVGSVSAEFPRLQIDTRRVSTKLRYTTSEYCTQTQLAEVPYYPVSFTSFLIFFFYFLSFHHIFPFFCVLPAGSSWCCSFGLTFSFRLPDGQRKRRLKNHVHHLLRLWSFAYSAVKIQACYLV